MVRPAALDGAERAGEANGMRWVLASMLVLTLALAGCRVKTPSSPLRPEMQPPVLPERFSDSGAARLPLRWWSTFEDPQLDRLVERALQDNFSLRAAEDRLARAAALVRVAQAPLRPSIDGTAAATGSRTRRESAGRRRISDDDSLSIGAAASYELDLWGRIRADRDAARWTAAATAADLDTARVAIAASVVTTWFRYSEERLTGRLLNEQIETNETLRGLIEGRFNMGQVGAADVLRQQQLVERTRGDLSTSRARAGELAHQLAALGGRAPTEAPPAVPTTLHDLPPLPATGIPAEALRARPDVEAAWSRVLAADRDLAVSLADRYPRVTLSAAALLGGGGFQAVFGDWFSRLAADLVAPLYDGGERRGRIDADRARRRELLNLYAEAILQAAREVEDALLNETQEQEHLESLERQLALADQVVETLINRYGQGAAEYLDVLAAIQSQQTLSRSVLVSGRLLLEYRVDLQRAVAGRLDPDLR